MSHAKIPSLLSNVEGGKKSAGLLPILRVTQNIFNQNLRTLDSFRLLEYIDKIKGLYFFFISSRMYMDAQIYCLLGQCSGELVLNVDK